MKIRKLRWQEDTCLPDTIVANAGMVGDFYIQKQMVSPRQYRHKVIYEYYGKEQTIWDTKDLGEAKWKAQSYFEDLALRAMAELVEGDGLGN